MLLSAGESVLRSAYAVLDPSGKTGDDAGPGVLSLTNRRLLFETHVSRGVLRNLVGGREARLVVDVPLVEARNASVRRGRLGRVRLVVEFARDRVVFDVLDPDAWAAAIAEARRELPPPGSASLAPTTTIQREVVKIRCRYCGSLGNEIDGRCPRCGAAL